jgi:LAO/AO transport system kinase
VRDTTRRVSELRDAVRAGDRRSLARLITHIESTRDDESELGQRVLEELVPHTGSAIRVGITGPPGVGKSTFIEALGLHLLETGHRVAVLAVDPSSPVAGGSILGDKTRMEELARDERAFVRPSPSGGSLGGVAHRTRECMLVCEAAGYDIVLIETVGIGQSEVAVASMVDFFLVLLLPAGGDELQGIKKGVMELADALVVNKSDGDTAAAAERTRVEYEGALGLIRSTSPSWSPVALAASALPCSTTGRSSRASSTSGAATRTAPGCGTSSRKLSSRPSATTRAWPPRSRGSSATSSSRRPRRPPPPASCSPPSARPAASPERIAANPRGPAPPTLADLPPLPAESDLACDRQSVLHSRVASADGG